jgi:hypothetical protein
MWLDKGEQLMLWKQMFPYDLSAETEAQPLVSRPENATLRS